jgi:hypothetical protein
MPSLNSTWPALGGASWEGVKRLSIAVVCSMNGVLDREKVGNPARRVASSDLHAALKKRLDKAFVGSLVIRPWSAEGSHGAERFRRGSMGSDVLVDEEILPLQSG